MNPSYDLSPVPDDLTICARLTPPGQSALATIGILGPDAIDLTAQLFKSVSNVSLVEAKTNRPYYGHFGSSVQDDVIVRVVRNDTRPEIEVHCHGGTAMVNALLSDLTQLGAKQVDWQAYSRRKGTSEIQIEALEALTKANTSRCAAILLDQLNGALERAFDNLTTTLDAHFAQTLRRRYPLGRHLVEPWRVALFGRPNVGKSSLLNALAGFDRAIVSEIAGTTRDVLTTQVTFDGWPIELLDGAGFRNSAEPIEALGKENFSKLLAGVDLRILVVDTSITQSAEDDSLVEQFGADMTVGTKSDLPSKWNDAGLSLLNHRCSAKTGAGIAELISAIAQRLVPEIPKAGDAVPFTQRHFDWLSQF